MSRGPVDKQQLATQIIQSAKAAGIEHFVLDFDGTVLANHFFYNEEYGKNFYDQDPAFGESNAAYKTKLKDGITQEQARGIFADFELFDAILNEAFRNKVTIHIASRQSYSAIASVLDRAGIREELITGGIHGNPHINGLESKSSPSDPRGNGGEKIKYIASLVEQGIDSSSIFYADDAELFGEKAIEAKKAKLKEKLKAKLREQGVEEGDLETIAESNAESNAELLQLRADVESIKDVTTFGCMNTEEMLPLTQDVVEDAVASKLGTAGMIKGDRIVGAGLDQSKWEMINAKFVEKVRLLQSRGGAEGHGSQGGASEAPPVPKRDKGYRRVMAAAAASQLPEEEDGPLPDISATTGSRRATSTTSAAATGSVRRMLPTPPVPIRGEGYERLRAESVSALTARENEEERLRREEYLKRRAEIYGSIGNEDEAAAASAVDVQGHDSLAEYLVSRGMMPSPESQERVAASPMLGIDLVKDSLEQSIDRFNQGYTANEAFNPRISGFANLLDGLIKTGRHNEAIMLVVLYGDQYLAPKQERVDGSPGRDFKDTKQFLKSSSDFIKSPAGVAALGQMLEEGLEFKDVMKVFASLKHVSNELNNKHLEEEKSQRRGTLSRAVGRLLSVSKRPPAAEASASGEQINFDCCETEIFTEFLSQFIERAEPANLMSLITTLQTASEVSKSRPGDNSLFGLKDAIVLQKAITEYSKREAPSHRPATTNVGDPSAVGSQAAIHRSTPR